MVVQDHLCEYNFHRASVLRQSFMFGEALKEHYKAAQPAEVPLLSPVAAKMSEARAGSFFV